MPHTLVAHLIKAGRPVKNGTEEKKQTKGKDSDIIEERKKHTDAAAPIQPQA